MKKIILTASIACLFIANTQAQFKDYTWKIINAVGSYLPREECDFVNVKGMFYLLGGRKIQDINVFNPKTSVWTTAAAPPVELNHFQAVVYKDEIYILGAMNMGYPHEKPLDHIYIYTPATNTWRTGAEIPKDRLRGSGGTVIYKNKIYFVCGIQDGHWTGGVTWFDEYDPQTNQWKKLPDAPVARDHFKAVVVADKLYCIGGGQSNAMEKKLLDKTIDEVDSYDFKNGTWTVATEKLPTQRTGVAVVAIDNEILVMAGESLAQKISHNEVEAYNLKNRQFRKLPPLVEGRHAGAALYYDKKIYAVAGVGNSGGSPLLSSIEVFSDK